MVSPEEQSPASDNIWTKMEPLLPTLPSSMPLAKILGCLGGGQRVNVWHLLLEDLSPESWPYVPYLFGGVLPNIVDVPHS